MFGAAFMPLSTPDRRNENRMEVFGCEVLQSFIDIPHPNEISTLEASIQNAEERRDIKAIITMGSLIQKYRSNVQHRNRK